MSMSSRRATGVVIAVCLTACTGGSQSIDRWETHQTGLFDRCRRAVVPIRGFVSDENPADVCAAAVDGLDPALYPQSVAAARHVVDALDTGRDPDPSVFFRPSITEHRR